MTLRLVFVLAAVGPVLASCAGGPAEFMREPRLSPVGSGLMSSGTEGASLTPAAGRPISPRLYLSRATSLYTEKRVSQVGDIVTVIISINDKATLGNSTDRSQTAKTNFAWDFAMNLVAPLAKSSSSSSSSSTPSTLTNDISSASTTEGKGTIDRSEKIQLSIAAVVTDVLPNGNLVISGSQEVRVNYELRQLTVGGIVRPTDVTNVNTVAYDRLAEARISYGGRGRVSEVQQPSWGQQIYDSVRPF